MRDYGSVLLGLGLIALIVWAARKYSKLPVRFTSLAEYSTVGDVANSAVRQLSPDDPRRRALEVIGIKLSEGFQPLPRPARFVRISADDLRVLAPFIDLSVDGKGPPINLPAEYQAEIENQRVARLVAFRARMQAQGLWPS